MENSVPSLLCTCWDARKKRRCRNKAVVHLRRRGRAGFDETLLCKKHVGKDCLNGRVVVEELETIEEFVLRVVEKRLNPPPPGTSEWFTLSKESRAIWGQPALPNKEQRELALEAISKMMADEVRAFMNRPSVTYLSRKEAEAIAEAINGFGDIIATTSTRRR